MTTQAPGTVAVIFVARRTSVDDDGYAKAAAAMVGLAQEQPGYAGIDSVRGSDGLGITISYWSDEVAAKAWRDNATHAAIRDRGRNLWYSDYSLHVAEIMRSYDWSKDA